MWRARRRWTRPCRESQYGLPPRRWYGRAWGPRGGRRVGGGGGGGAGGPRPDDRRFPVGARGWGGVFPLTRELKPQRGGPAAARRRRGGGDASMGSWSRYGFPADLAAAT